jgi:hypothetical protein
LLAKVVHLTRCAAMMVAQGLLLLLRLLRHWMSVFVSIMTGARSRKADVVLLRIARQTYLLSLPVLCEGVMGKDVVAGQVGLAQLTVGWRAVLLLVSVSGNALLVG